MLIRGYAPEDCEATAALLCESIKMVCAGDYTPGQLRAWQSGCSDLGENVVEREGESLTNSTMVKRRP